MTPSSGCQSCSWGGEPQPLLLILDCTLWVPSDGACTGKEASRQFTSRPLCSWLCFSWGSLALQADALHSLAHVCQGDGAIPICVQEPQR